MRQHRRRRIAQDAVMKKLKQKAPRPKPMTTTPLTRPLRCGSHCTAAVVGHVYTRPVPSPKSAP